MPYFDGATGRVYYRAWEAPDARAAVVFLHGYGEHSGLYHRLAAALDQRGISLWALDEIGHGLSEGPRGYVGTSLDGLEANGRRLATIAAQARPGLPLVIAGHSLGGATTALMIARDPQPFAGAVLSGTPLSPPAWMADLDPGAGLDLDASDLSSDPSYLDQLANDPLAFTDSESGPMDALPSAWEELERRLSEVTLPILFIHGELDPVAPIATNRQWAARLPCARMEAFAGARHDALNEHVHREVAARIADFALEVAGAGEPGAGRA